MKKHLPLILSFVVICGLLVMCLSEIFILQKDVQTLRNTLYDHFSQIYSQNTDLYQALERQLKEGTGLLVDSAWHFGEVNLAEKTVMAKFSVYPKEYIPQKTQAMLFCNGNAYPMTEENGGFLLETPIALFEETKIDRVQFMDDGQVRTELLNWNLLPRYDVFPVVWAEFGFSSHWDVENNQVVQHYDGNIYAGMDCPQGKTGHMQAVWLIEEIDGTEVHRAEIPLEDSDYARPEQLSGDEPLVSAFPNDLDYHFVKDVYIPFGSVYALSVEIVDQDGLHHRKLLSCKAVNEAGTSVRSLLDHRVHSAEASLYDAQGNMLFKSEADSVY